MRNHAKRNSRDLQTRVLLLVLWERAAAAGLDARIWADASFRRCGGWRVLPSKKQQLAPPPRWPASRSPGGPVTAGSGRRPAAARSGCPCPAVLLCPGPGLRAPPSTLSTDWRTKHDEVFSHAREFVQGSADETSSGERRGVRPAGSAHCRRADEEGAAPRSILS